MIASRFEILIAGDAGQGVLTTAVRVARLITEQGFSVCQSARYGSAARAGQVLAGIVISRDEIDFPCVEAADILIAMSSDGYRLAIDQLKDNGTLIASGIPLMQDLPRGITSAPESALRPVSAEGLVEAIRRIGGLS